MFFLPKINSKHDLLDAELRIKLESKNLIFTYSTGRSGTNFLQNVLANCQDIDSLHEPAPRFTDSYQNAKFNTNIAINFLINKKLPFIAETKKRHYSETSHIFSKAFLSPLLELGICPKLIFIYRNPRKVAESFLQIDSTPLRTLKGRQFLISPNDNVLLPLVNYSDLSDYQLCYWYVLEVYYRAYIYKKFLKNNSIDFFDFDFDLDINPKSIYKLIDFLGLELIPGVDINVLAENKVNSKAHIKEAYLKNNTVQICYDKEEQELLAQLQLPHDFLKSCNIVKN